MATSSAVPSSIVAGTTSSRAVPVIFNHGARIFLTRLFVVGIMILVLITKSSILSPASWLHGFTSFMGLTLAVCAMAGRMWCSLFIAGKKNTLLVREGPYAHCRNPLYFFSFLGGTGVALASGLFTVTVLVMLGFALYYPTVIQREEAFLRQRHGTDFETYIAATPSFWPRLTRPHAPAEWTCHPSVFLKHLGSAIWFPIAFWLVHEIKVLQDMAWFNPLCLLP